MGTQKLLDCAYVGMCCNKTEYCMLHPKKTMLHPTDVID